MKISLVPNLEKFVAEKIKSGDYQDHSEVIRDSLRRWKEREEAGVLEREWLEREIQEGFDSPDLPLTKAFSVWQPFGMKACAAEFIGTFALVFAGTGAIVINQASGGAITHAGTALTFGLIVLAMIYALGDVSGAHLNPAVTLGFWVARRFSAAAVPGYVV